MRIELFLLKIIVMFLSGLCAYFSDNMFKILVACYLAGILWSMNKRD